MTSSTEAGLGGTTPGPASVAAEPDEVGRPTAHLPWSQLVSMSVYWFGISAIWGGYEIFGQQRVEAFVGTDDRGAVMGYLESLGALVAILVVPTAGTISDYTVSRWGRRKPFILFGAIFDVVFIFALINSQTLLAFAAAYLFLQLSSNLAQGPFQGYVPDLVPERQVTVASGLLGLMRMTGLLGGVFIVSSGAATGDYGLPLLVIGLIELSLAIATVVLVREGASARPRNGRSWFAIAREAWGTDVLRERSFLFMSATRLFFLMGTSAFVNFSLFYVRDTLGQSDDDLTFWIRVGLGCFLVGTAAGTIPGAWLADRIGRKNVIWGAAALAATGIFLTARAGSPEEALPGLILMGIGNGAYLAVDWALMTSVIPKIASGRYMGLANIANSISGPLAVVIAGRVLDAMTASAGLEAAPRFAVSTGILFLAGASVMLTFVHPPEPVPA
ncbi:MAG TPA: MFS transporter [Candidatus Limnocylindrales bacterium]|nr:MFS transporter [Candidatus Limnocylindrales bacterium]